jgi:flagellar basal body P-ring formation protein FlgA
MALKLKAIEDTQDALACPWNERHVRNSFSLQPSAFVLLCCLFSFSCPAFALTVALKSDATVTEPMVTIGDVAMVTGEGADAITALDLGPAPKPGVERRIAAAAIALRIRGTGLADKSLDVTGAPAVRVTGPCERVTRDLIAEDLRRFIEAKMPWNASDTEIEVAGPAQDITLPPGEVVVEWQTDPQYRFLGSGAFRGVVSVDGKPCKTIKCRAKVAAFAEVVVAASVLSAGRPIALKDVVLERTSVSTMREGAFQDPAEVLGMVPRVTVAAGQVLTRRVMTPRPAVKRNQMVMVETRRGGLSVETQARAETDGAIGAIVTCTNIESKQPFQGVVREDGVVVIR